VVVERIDPMTGRLRAGPRTDATTQIG
jgi:hypothetical protein